VVQLVVQNVLGVSTPAQQFSMR